jgi:hypothetical protein
VQTVVHCGGWTNKAIPRAASLSEWPCEDGADGFVQKWRHKVGACQPVVGATWSLP